MIIPKTRPIRLYSAICKDVAFTNDISGSQPYCNAIARDLLFSKFWKLKERSEIRNEANNQLLRCNAKLPSWLDSYSISYPVGLQLKLAIFVCDFLTNKRPYQSLIDKNEILVWLGIIQSSQCYLNIYPAQPFWDMRSDIWKFPFENRQLQSRGL
jgi:hypothetical protein